MILLNVPHETLQLWIIDALGCALVLVIAFVGSDFSKQLKGLRRDFQQSQLNDAKTQSELGNLITSNRDLWDEIKEIRDVIGELKEGAKERETLIKELEKGNDEIKKDLKEVTQVQNRCISCNDNKK